MPNRSSVSRLRRTLLKACTVVAVEALAGPALAITTRPVVRSLAFMHIHTGERGTIVYWEHGRYSPEGLAQINYLLRDHYNDQVAVIDPTLVDLMYRLVQRLDTRKPLHIISAYRSPETNERLRGRSNGVAKHSLHLDGKAVDIRIPGHDLRHVQRAALGLKGGGVGLYSRSQFVHIDVGGVRRWGA